MRRRRMHGRKRRKSPLLMEKDQELVSPKPGDGEESTSVNAEQAKDVAGVDSTEGKGDLDHTHKGGGLEEGGPKEEGAAESSAAKRAARHTGGRMNDGAWGLKSGGW